MNSKSSKISYPKLAELQAERARRSLTEFVRQGWQVLESTPPVWNWHIEVVCDHLQALLEDWMQVKTDPTYPQRAQNLLINIPPGTAKSRLVSVFTPAWMWLHWPAWRAIFLSANPSVAQRDSMYCREVIESEWYQQSFRPDWKLSPDQNAKNYYRNTAGGYRQARGFFAKITGDRADALVVDDPHDAGEVTSDVRRTAILERWDTAIANRVNDPEISLRVGVMQRLHEDDWSGHVLKAGDWEHLCLPQEFEPDFASPPNFLGWRDPRSTAGELLFPARFPPAVLERERKRLGSYGYAGQHQQRPVPSEGGMFKTHWWRFWHYPGQPLPPVSVKLPTGQFVECPVIPLPEVFDEVLQSWDMTFKDTSASDYVVGQVWAARHADRFLLDETRGRFDFLASCTALKHLTAKWPLARVKLIEDKANGPAVISTLNSRVGGLIAVNPSGSKEERAASCTPEIEAGNVYLPHPELCAWTEEWIGELAVFPRGSHDDRVDGMSQALIRWGRDRFVASISDASPYKIPQPTGMDAILAELNL